MEQTNQKSQCQQLWARNKYLVLEPFQQYLQWDSPILEEWKVELSQVQEMIDRACQIPRTQGSGLQCLSAYLGLFQKESDRCWAQDYMLLLDRYRFGQASKEDLVAKTRDLLDRYPNTYLQHSTLLKGDSHETLAWGFDFTTSPSSTFGPTSRMLCLAWQWLGQKACDGGLCLYPFALSSLCLPWLDHEGDG